MMIYPLSLCVKEKSRENNPCGYGKGLIPLRIKIGPIVFPIRFKGYILVITGVFFPILLLGIQKAAVSEKQA
jgi:hypothetical protein